MRRSNFFLRCCGCWWGGWVSAWCVGFALHSAEQTVGRGEEGGEDQKHQASLIVSSSSLSPSSLPSPPTRPPTHPPTGQGDALRESCVHRGGGSPPRHCAPRESPSPRPNSQLPQEAHPFVFHPPTPPHPTHAHSNPHQAKHGRRRRPSSSSSSPSSSRARGPCRGGGSHSSSSARGRSPSGKSTHPPTHPNLTQAHPPTHPTGAWPGPLMAAPWYEALG